MIQETSGISSVILLALPSTILPCTIVFWSCQLNLSFILGDFWFSFWDYFIFWTISQYCTWVVLFPVLVCNFMPTTILFLSLWAIKYPYFSFLRGFVSFWFGLLSYQSAINADLANSTSVALLDFKPNICRSSWHLHRIISLWTWNHWWSWRYRSIESSAYLPQTPASVLTCSREP